MSVEESVRRNIQMLLNSGRILDGDLSKQSEEDIPAIVDQIAHSEGAMQSYEVKLAALILRHEPRLDMVEVETIEITNQGEARCELRLTIGALETSCHFVF